jgi:hypothetical protein
VEAVEIEKQFITESLPCHLIGNAVEAPDRVLSQWVVASYRTKEENEKP